MLSNLYAGAAHAADVCNNSPGPGDRIVCHEESASTNPININVTGIDIDTTGAHEHGVHALHEGPGNTNIRITGTTATPSTIDATGARARGIQYHHDTGSSGTATLTLDNTEITTQSNGILGLHQGSGVIKADLRTGVVINTSGATGHGVSLSQENSGGNHAAIIQAQGIQATIRGERAYGLWARQFGSGEAQINVRDSTIRTHGTQGYGMYGYRHDSSGDIDIDVMGGSTTTSGPLSFGIYAKHEDNGGNHTGNIEIHTRNHTIETTATAQHPDLPGTYAYGIYADHYASGNIVIDLGEGSSVTTHGRNSHGFVAYQRHADDPGSVDITVNGSVTVSGAAAQGVRVGAIGSSGPERMAPLDSAGYRQHTVTVNGPITSTGEGVYLANGGRVIIGPQGSISSGSGIAILATGTVPEDNTDPQNMIPAIPPKLRVDLNLGGRRVSEAIGDDWIVNDGGETTIAVNRIVLHDGATGNTGRTARNGVWDVTLADPGVKVTDRTTDPWTTAASTAPADRDFRADDFGEVEAHCPTGQIGTPPNCRMPPPPTPRRPPPEPEPEPQVHQVNEAISAGTDAPAGVVVQGDGEVYIGAQGRIEAASGIAILATGDDPDLLVDIDLDGRQVSEVIGDDWIINDGGGTTLVINDVKLHDGETGVVPEASAPNGAFNVRVMAEGVRIIDHTDPDPSNWTVSARQAGIVADRDFSAADFIETREEPEPEPEPQPQPPMLIEEYAPRAALYEALPEFLLGLQTGDLSGQYRFLPKPPVWIELRGGSGSQDFERSTVGAKYDADYFVVEAGATVLEREHWNVRASLHRVTGSADVSSPVKGGDIHAKGAGLSFDAHWHNEASYYAAGCFSWTNYDLDISSDTVGRLISAVDADGLALHVEAGRRMRWGEDRVWWTPHVWLDRTRISVDSFTDAVEARASFPDAKRTTAGFGLMAETVKDMPGGELALRASLDIEHRFGGTDTSSRVSGERLSAEPEENSALLALGSAWRQGPWVIDAVISAREGSGDDSYSGSLNLGMRF